MYRRATGVAAPVPHPAHPTASPRPAPGFTFVPAGMHQTASTRAILGPAGLSFPQAMHQTAWMRTASGPDGPNFRHGMHQLTSTITASSPAGPSRLAMPNISGHGIDPRPSPAGGKEDLSEHAPQTAPQTNLNQAASDRRRPYLNPNAPEFEPTRFGQPGLSLNPTTTMSEPILTDPTNLVDIPAEVKENLSYIFEDTPHGLQYFARDIGRIMREIQGGKANTEPGQKALKISLTACISYIDKLAEEMEEARGTRRLSMPIDEEPGASGGLED